MTAGEFRTGSIFKMDGSFYKVIESATSQQQRQSSIVRTKIRDMETGVVKEMRFSPTDFFPDVELSFQKMQFMFNEGKVYHFMNVEDFEQIAVDESMIKDAIVYNSEDATFTFKYADDKLIEVTPAETFVIMKIEECPPAVAGDTARSALKNATLEGGLVIKVPMFVNSGDRVKVDTRSGTYVERA